MISIVCAALLFGTTHQLDATHERDAIALYESASALIDARQSEQAIVPLTSLIQLHPHSALACVAALHLAECYLIAGRYLDAQDLLNRWQDRLSTTRQALTLVPDLTDRVQRLRVRILLEQVRAQEQAGQFRQALELLSTPHHGDVESGPEVLREERLRVLARGCIQTLRSGEDYQDWLSSCSQRDAPPIRLLVLDELVKRRDFEAAREQIEWFQNATESLVDYQPILAIRECELQVAQGNYAEAKDSIEKARASGPRPAVTAHLDFLVVRCHIASVEFKEAAGVLDSIANNPAHSPDLRAKAQWMLGEVHFLTQDFPQAIAAYEQACDLKVRRWEWRALLQKGKCLERQQALEAAKATYQRLIEDYQDTPALEQAASRLAQLNEIDLQHQ